MGSDVTKIVTCVAFRVMGKRGVGGRSVKNKTGTGIGGEGRRVTHKVQTDEKSSGGQR